MESNDSDPDPPVAVRLFHLPEYEFAFLRFVRNAIDQLIVRKSPFLSKIKAVSSPEIYTSRNTMSSGEVIESAPMKVSLPIELNLSQAVTGELSPITEAINNAAEEALKTMAPQLSEYVGRMCHAAGTSTELVEGEELGHKLILKLLENMELDFHEDGSPDLGSIAVGLRNLEIVETVVDLVDALPSRTKEETEEWNSLIDRKRKEFNGRRRHRKLS